ncbi:MAG TPA: VIT1/CCC1 transporter family protein [Burkholderiaceae bacterium]|nr:VIT1/CCC1 transporter family protein [Burkholderiaceae bacterium]
MSTYLHRETHFQSSDLLRDIVIGMADGLTVPFALAAGISGAVAGSGVVVTAGVAEIAAGSIAMGLGGYLAARGDMEHYASELVREEQEILEKPQAEIEEIGEVFRQYGLSEQHYGGVIEGLKANPLAWRDFMMRFELGLQKPDPKRAGRSALTIGASYIVGGLVPLTPYMASASAAQALPWSIGVTLAALAVFGFVKGQFTGAPPLKSALQTASIGGVAAAVAFALARAIS